MLHRTILSLLTAAVLILPVTAAAQEGSAPHGFAFDNPETYMAYPALLGGPGTVYYAEGFSKNDFTSKYRFVRTGIIPSKSGIGEHRAVDSEELFVILGGSVFVRFEGCTALLNSGMMIPCRIGETIGLYNPTAENVRFVWIAVAAEDVPYHPAETGFDLTTLKQEVLCPVPAVSFMGADYEHPIESAHGGRGPIYDTLGYIVHAYFGLRWSASPMILPPGTSIGYHRHDVHEEIFFVVSGTARATVDGVTLDQGAGDCTICTVGSTHGIYNSGTEDLHIIVSSLSAVPSGSRSSVDLGDDLVGK